MPPRPSSTPRCAPPPTTRSCRLLDGPRRRYRCPLPGGLRLVVDAGTGPLLKRTSPSGGGMRAAARALGVSSLREVSDLAAALARITTRRCGTASGTRSRKLPSTRSGPPRRLRRGDRSRAQRGTVARTPSLVCPRLDTAADTAVQRCTGARMGGPGHRAPLVPAERSTGACGTGQPPRAAGLRRRVGGLTPPRRAPAAEPTSTRTPPH